MFGSFSCSVCAGKLAQTKHKQLHYLGTSFHISRIGTVKIKQNTVASLITTIHLQLLPIKLSRESSPESKVSLSG